MEVVERLRCQPRTITFRELRQICEECFGVPRRQRGSHLIFKTKLRNHALINIQARGKMAKPYQCRQVASAIEAMLKGSG